MQREPAAFLWDVHESALRIREFVFGHDFEAFSASVLLQSAIERQFEIIGEALKQSRTRVEKLDRITQRPETMGGTPMGAEVFCGRLRPYQGGERRSSSAGRTSPDYQCGQLTHFRRYRTGVHLTTIGAPEAAAVAACLGTVLRSHFRIDASYYRWINFLI